MSLWSLLQKKKKKNPMASLGNLTAEKWRRRRRRKGKKKKTLKILKARHLASTAGSGGAWALSALLITMCISMAKHLVLVDGIST